MQTMYEFFSPAPGDVVKALDHAAGGAKLAASVPAGLIRSAVEDELKDLIDISLIGVMLRAWKKYELVRKYLGQNAPQTAETKLVPLLEHTIESSHEPYIQVLRANVPIVKVKFKVSIEIAVEALVLRVRAGRIQEIAAGRFIASGSLGCEGVTVAEKSLKPLNIPAGYSIGSKDEADSEEEDASAD